MSLVNEYLKKTQEEAPHLSQVSAVPPSLTGSRRPRRRGAAYLALAAGLIVVAAVGLVFFSRSTGPRAPLAPAVTDRIAAVPAAPAQAPTSGQVPPPTAAQAPAPAAVPAPAPTAAQASREVPASAPVQTSPAPPAGAAVQAPLQSAAQAPRPVLTPAQAPAAAPAQKVLAAAPPSRLESVEAVKKITPPEVKLLARSAEESPAAKSVEKAAPVMETAVVRSRPMVEERSQTTAAVKASSPPAETAAPSPVAVSSRRPQAAVAAPIREKAPPSPALPSPAARTATQYFQLGQVAQRDGDWTGAETYYLAGLKEMPDHVKMLTNLSAVYIRQNRFEEAGRILERARSLAPGDVSVLVNLGNVELGQKRYDRARAWFLQAVQIDPGSETALNNLAYLAQLRGDLTEMETYYQKILAVSPKNSEVLLALAGALEKKERWQEAIACYERSLEIERVREDRELAGRIKNRIRLLNRMDSERAGADRSTQQP